MDIANIFCQSLGVTSLAKTFLTVCRFRTDLVSVWTAWGIRSKTIVIRSSGFGYLFGKNCHPFERLRLSVWKKLSSVRTAWDIRLKKLLSVQTARAICSKKNLSTVRATEEIEKRIPQTLTNSKNIIQTDREYARRSSRARSTHTRLNLNGWKKINIIRRVCGVTRRPISFTKECK